MSALVFQHEIFVLYVLSELQKVYPKCSQNGGSVRLAEIT